MPGDLDRLERTLGHRFADPELARLALTHRSAAAENNERLEFLGDAVLDMAVAAVLYARHPAADEGELSRMRTALVNGEALAAAARRLGLEEHLALGRGVRPRDSMLADALEALLAALYLDAGLEPCSRMVAGWIAARDPSPPRGPSPLRKKDRKSRLQELMQARRASLPDYQVEAVSGPEHERVFRVSCRVPLLDEAQTGEGSSRREAEQAAAGRALERLGEAP